MIDKLNELEQRVTHLLEHLRQAQAEVSDLQGANEELKQQLGDREKLTDENRALREKVEALEAELGSFSEREGEIRGRVQTILERIASLESGLQDSGQGSQ
jgi:chromosome segregation ATPase